MRLTLKPLGRKLKEQESECLTENFIGINLCYSDDVQTVEVWAEKKIQTVITDMFISDMLISEPVWSLIYLLLIKCSYRWMISLIDTW